jgi:hypothetical protein
VQESPRAQQAWADYLALGELRSLAALVAEYQSRTTAVPTRQLSRLKFWSTTFDWQGRLATITADAVAAAEAQEAAYRHEVLTTGYAQSHERIATLNELASILHEELTTKGPRNRRWVRDVKQVGSGEDAERVDIERFNGAEVAQLRGLLDDIAKELGERKEHVEHGGEIGIRQLVGVDLAQL